PACRPLPASCPARSTYRPPPRVFSQPFSTAAFLAQHFPFCNFSCVMQIMQVPGLRGTAMKRSKRLSQADIAERLGISISTVSRALADESTISLPVRQEVRQLARSLGYRGKRTGGRLIDRSVCALVPLGGATSGLSGFYFGIAEGMREAADQAGMALDVRLIDEHSVSIDLMRRYVTDSGASALLLAGVDATDELVAWCKAEDLGI